MARVCKLLLVAVLSALSGTAAALGLGDITLRSALNQRLDAQIEIVAALPGDLTELEAELATRELFVQYGIDYPQFLTGLTFEATRTADGSDVLQVRSSAPITEPFVTFLVEANWPRGRLLREYTVLLDPPSFLPGEADTSVAPAMGGSSAGADNRGVIGSAPSSSRPVTGGGSRPPARSSSTSSRSSPRATGGVSAGSEYGPVQRGESLWKIAARARPSGASLNQTMMAIYRQNPNAFLGNMNLLRQGATLRIPSADAIRGVSTGEANATLVADTARWRGDATGPAPAASAGTSASAVTPALASSTVPSGTPELQLVAPDGELAALARDLDTVRDQNDALRQTVQEQRTQLEQTQERLRLRDAQLAELQRQLADAQAQEVAAAPAPAAGEGMEESRTTPGATLDAAAGEQATTLAEEPAEPTTAAVIDAPVNEEPVAEEADAGAQGTSPPAAVAQNTDTAPAPAPAETTPAPRSNTTSVSTPAPAGGGPLDFLLGLLGSTYVWLGVGLAALLGAGAIVLRNRSNSAQEEPLDELSAFPEDGDLDATMATTVATTGATPLPGVDGDRTYTTTMDTELRADEDALSRTALVEPSASTSDTTAEVSIAQPMEAGEFNDTGQFEAITTGSNPAHEPTQLIDIGDGGEDGNDPMSEADFHMAYGLFDQAADLINKALETEPERTDLQAKLLEIYFVWGNKDAFREAAERLKPSLSQAEGGWEKFAIMGRQICPDDELFVTDGDVGAAALADLDVGTETTAAPQDLSLDTASTDDDVLDIGLDELPEVPDLGPVEDDPAALTLGDSADVPEVSLEGVDVDEDGALDIDLDLPPPLPDDGMDDDTEIQLQDVGIPEISLDEVSVDEEVTLDEVEVSLDDVTLDPEGDLEPDEELTEIARKLEARMAPSSEATENLDLSLDLGQTIAPEAPPETSVRLDVDDEDDDGFGDFFAFTGVVDESVRAEEDEAPPVEEHVLDASGDLLGLASTGEFKIELPDEEIPPIEVTSDLTQGGDVTGKSLTLGDGDAAGASDQPPTVELPGGGLSVGDETQEGFMLTPAADASEGEVDESEQTSLISAATMIGTDGFDDKTVKSPLIDSQDPSESSIAPTIQMPIAPEVSSTAETVSAQVLNLPQRGNEEGSEETTRVAASQLAFPEADDNTLDEVGTKLDLARAYIDMGDSESARSILEEVVQEGSTEQRDDANSLLSSLG